MKAMKDYINLLPPKEKKPGGKWSRASLSLIVFLLVWLGLYGWQVNAAWDLKKQLSRLSAQRLTLLQELDSLRKELGVTVPSSMNQEKAALIKNLLGERVLWSDVFKQFSRIVPRGLWFDSLEGNTADRSEIRLRGGAFTYLSVAEFMLAMERSGYFTNPQLMYAQKAVVEGHDVVGFEITCGVRKGAGSQ